MKVIYKKCLFLFLLAVICTENDKEKRCEYFRSILFSNHKLINYFESYNFHSTVDVVGAFRMAQGQLSRINPEALKDGDEFCNVKDLKKKVKNLLERIDRLAIRTSINVVGQRKEIGYYSRFIKILNVPFIYNVKWKRINSSLESNNSLNINSLTDYDVAFGDRCYEKLFGTDSILDHNCYVDDHCLNYMIYRDNLAGYALSHKVLYGILLNYLNCSTIIERLSKERNVSKSFLLAYECSLIKNEVEGIYNYILTKKDKLTEKELALQDLFTENLMLCGVEGYWQILQHKYIELILEWQNEKGCFILLRIESYNNKNYVECSSHHNSLTMALLSTLIRFHLEIQVFI